MHFFAAQMTRPSHPFTGSSVSTSAGFCPSTVHSKRFSHKQVHMLATDHRSCPHHHHRNSTGAGGGGAGFNVGTNLLDPVVVIDISLHEFQGTAENARQDARCEGKGSLTGDSCMQTRTSRNIMCFCNSTLTYHTGQPADQRVDAHPVSYMDDTYSPRLM